MSAPIKKIPTPTLVLVVRHDRLVAECDVTRQTGRVQFMTNAVVRRGDQILGRRKIVGKATPEYVLRDFRKDPIPYGVQREWGWHKFDVVTDFLATLDGVLVARGRMKGEFDEAYVREEIRRTTYNVEPGPALELALGLSLV